MIEKLADIQWGSLHNMPYLALAIGIIIFCFVRIIRLTKAYERLARSRYARQFLVHASLFRAWIKALLYSGAVLAIFFAMLQPMIKKADEKVKQEGRDVFIALDISRSMLATDCTPSRLQCAKEKIKQLLSLLSCERVGLILFSGSSIIQCPLTTDYHAFNLFLDAVDVETISSGTTSLEQAVAQARSAYQSMPSKKNKLLLIVTDGEDFSSNLSAMKDAAIQDGIHIFTLGVGSVEGAPIPLFDVNGSVIGHQKDARGAVVISRLNEGILQNLATQTGSTYVRVTNDNSDARAIANTITTFEKEQFDETSVSRFEEQYPYFLLVSFFCLLLEWIL